MNKFSYILHKNPNSPPYEKELNSGKIVARFLNDNTYEIVLNEDPLSFLNTAKKLNLDVYLNKELNCVCNYNLKALYEVLRSVLKGKTNTPPEIMTEDEFLNKNYHGMIIGPFVNSFEFVDEIFNAFDLSVSKVSPNPTANTFETAFMLNVSNLKEMSLTEFLQKVYIISLFLSHNRNTIFSINEDVIDKLISLSIDWLPKSEKYKMIINKFCKNSIKLKKKFINAIENNEEESIESIERKNISS